MTNWNEAARRLRYQEWLIKCVWGGTANNNDKIKCFWAVSALNEQDV